MMSDELPADAQVLLSTEQAHRFLARAVALDAVRGSEVTIEQVRVAALEAGVDAGAITTALDELRVQLLREQRSSRQRVPSGLLHRLWRRVIGAEEGPTDAVTVWNAIAANVVAFAAFWTLLGVGMSAARSLQAPWQVSHAVAIAANLLGVGIAVRLRARTVAMLLAVTAAAQAAEYPIQLLFGIDQVQGGATKWAMMIASALGLILGALLMRTRRPSSVPPGVSPESATAAQAQTSHGQARWWSRFLPTDVARHAV